MQSSTLGRSDDIGCGACSCGFAKFHLPHGAHCAGHAIHRAERCLAGTSTEVAAGDRDAQAGNTGGQLWFDRFVHPLCADRILLVGPGHRVMGECQVHRVARKWSKVIEAGNEREAAGTG